MTQSPSSSSSPDGSSSSDCTVCSQPIPAKRLAALPLTTLCVACVLASGDPKIRRFDDYYGTEAEHCESTFFYPGDQYMDKALSKLVRFAGLGGWHEESLPSNLEKRVFCTTDDIDPVGLRNPVYAGPAYINHINMDTNDES